MKGNGKIRHMAQRALQPVKIVRLINLESSHRKHDAASPSASRTANEKCAEHPCFRQTQIGNNINVSSRTSLDLTECEIILVWATGFSANTVIMTVWKVRIGACAIFTFFLFSLQIWWPFKVCLMKKEACKCALQSKWNLLGPQQTSIRPVVGTLNPYNFKEVY